MVLTVLVSNSDIILKACNCIRTQLIKCEYSAFHSLHSEKKLLLICDTSSPASDCFSDSCSQYATSSFHAMVADLFTYAESLS